MAILSSSGMTIQDKFYEAVFSGNFAEAETLLGQGARIDENEILHSAAQGGRTQILEFLFRFRGREFINQFDDLSLTPLAYAARERQLETVKLLLREGADVNAAHTSHAGNTALREATEAGHLEVVRALLEAGADPHIPGWMHITAMHKAKERGGEMLALFTSHVSKAEKILSLAKQRRNKKGRS